MTRRVIWKRARAHGQTHTTREQVDEMAVSGTQLTDAHRAKAREALNALGDDPAFAGVIGPLRGVVASLNDDSDQQEGQLAKAMIALSDSRTRIEKGEQHASSAMRERLARAERALQEEYLRGCSGYWSGEAAELAQEVRKREAGVTA